MNNECFALGRLMATRGVADKMNDCPEFERFCAAGLRPVSPLRLGRSDG